MQARKNAPWNVCKFSHTCVIRSFGHSQTVFRACALYMVLTRVFSDMRSTLNGLHIRNTVRVAGTHNLTFVI